ncbi:unnamed protein product [Calicophoron daubneyi]|uniref:CRAL-TRIO domain-containing protein n=1 Tax=Calicophoron daubneyi TaxID=300641 RepID=A0AAV2T785_CALDB
MDLCIDVIELPEDVVEKAKIELGEAPDERMEAISELKNQILQQDIQGCLSDGFLLRFLRFEKFNVENALQAYNDYYGVRRLYPEVFENLRPTLVEHVFTDRVAARLESPTSDGCPVIYFHPGQWDPQQWPLMDIFRANFLLAEELLLRWPSAQVHGVVILVNLSGFSWSHCTSMLDLSFLRMAVHFLQGCTPIRIRAIHIFNQPLLFGCIFSIFKPLLKENMQNRIKLHGNSLESLHADLPPQILPINCELGGTAKAIPNQTYLDELRQLDAFFEKLTKPPMEKDTTEE